MKSILRAIAVILRAAMQAVQELVMIAVRAADGAIMFVAQMIRRPAAAASHPDDVADEAVADRPEADERKVEARWDPADNLNVATRCLASMALRTPWPGAAGLPQHVVAWLATLTDSQARTLLSAPRAAIEDHLAGRTAVTGVPRVYRPGTYAVPESWLRPGAGPQAEVPKIDVYARVAKAVAKAADETPAPAFR